MERKSKIQRLFEEVKAAGRSSCVYDMADGEYNAVIYTDRVNTEFLIEAQGNGPEEAMLNAIRDAKEMGYLPKEGRR